MPVLCHGDFELFESKAIATYLDRSFQGPELIPAHPRLAGLTEQWVSLVNTMMDLTLVRTYLLAHAAPKTADGRPDEKTIDAVTPAVRAQLGVLEAAVAKTGYLVAEQFTLADINLLPILCYIRQLPQRWPWRGLSDATMSVTRRGRVSSARRRRPARRAGTAAPMRRARAYVDQTKSAAARGRDDADR
jgi:glutathione S-transferase